MTAEATEAGTGPGPRGGNDRPSESGGDRPLRIALLSYKGNPFCGGQGVYVRHLSRELARLGHSVEVIGAQPYPVLDEGIPLTELPSLDLYRQPDPFRTPRRDEFRDWIDGLEVATMWTGGFPEPLTFSLRARRHLAARAGQFDVVHDNQTLGYGLLGDLGAPLVTTIHHPITVDRRLDLEAAENWRRRASVRRWYGFTRMQKRVARRLPSVLTVSGSSKQEITDHLGVRADRIEVVHIGADTELFSPDPAVPEIPGRIVTTASADVPLKGLVHLVEALAKLRTEHPGAHLVVVGRRAEDGPVAQAIERYGLEDAVEFVKGVSDAELVDLVRGARIACVPSLYEGFSLPAAEAMATGTPLVATTGGAIPEVAGVDGETCLAVPPGDAGALAHALGRLLDDPELRARLGAAGRERVLARFTWARAAQGTAELYRAAIAHSPKAGSPKAGSPNARSPKAGPSAARPSDRESRTTQC
ncbi:glycosyltransferase family 4 protein [Streptomyces sp. NPDC055037]